jgi:colicin import membrane protein
MIAISAAVLIHAVLIGFMVFNFSFKSKQTEQAAFAEKVDIVKATTVDASAIEKEKQKLIEKELEKKRKEAEERKRLEDLKKKRELEEKQIKDLKEKQKQEKQKAEALEAERKAIALKRKQEEEKRKKEEAERKKKEQERIRKEKERKKQEAERRAKEEAERKKQAEEQARQKRLADALAAEEAFQAEQLAMQRATTLLGKYTALITQKVSRYWAIAPDYVPGLETKVNVKLSSYGDVRSVAILKSSGNPRFDRSVESAILKATPLPIPSVAEDAGVNKQFQNLNLNFKPEDLR